MDTKVNEFGTDAASQLPVGPLGQRTDVLNQARALLASVKVSESNNNVHITISRGHKGFWSAEPSPPGHDLFRDWECKRKEVLAAVEDELAKVAEGSGVAASPPTPTPSLSKLLKVNADLMLVLKSVQTHFRMCPETLLNSALLALVDNTLTAAQQEE